MRSAQELGGNSAPVRFPIVARAKQELSAAATCRASSTGTYGTEPPFEGMARYRIREALTNIGTLTARPSAFLVLAGFTGAWLIFERETLDWHGIATLATWAMTLLIQRAEHRDTQALQAKLDELITSSRTASDAVAGIDEKEPEEIEKVRDKRRNISERSRLDT